jgi:hypothetical protein
MVTIAKTFPEESLSTAVGCCYCKIASKSYIKIASNAAHTRGKPQRGERGLTPGREMEAKGSMLPLNNLSQIRLGSLMN